MSSNSLMHEWPLYFALLTHMMGDWGLISQGMVAS